MSVPPSYPYAPFGYSFERPRSLSTSPDGGDNSVGWKEDVEMKRRGEMESGDVVVDDGKDGEEEELEWDKFRIAVVDDNHINLKILCRYLKRFLNVTIHPSDQFTDGSQCVEALKTREYDLVLLDIEMPILDGCETTICIRNGLDSPPLQTSGVPNSHHRAHSAQYTATPTLTPTSPPTSESNCTSSPTSLKSQMSVAAESDGSGPQRNEFPFPLHAMQRDQVPGHASSPGFMTPYPTSSSAASTFSPHTHQQQPIYSSAPILPANRTTPIIAVTTNALPHQQRHYLSLGMDDVVAKPLIASVLVESVKKALRGVEKRRRARVELWRGAGEKGGMVGGERVVRRGSPFSVGKGEQLVRQSSVKSRPRSYSSPAPSTHPYVRQTPRPTPPSPHSSHLQSDSKTPSPVPSTSPPPSLVSPASHLTRSAFLNVPEHHPSFTESDSDQDSDDSSSSIASILGTELHLSSKCVPVLLRRVGSRSSSRTPSPVSGSSSAY